MVPDLAYTFKSPVQDARQLSLQFIQQLWVLFVRTNPPSSIREVTQLYRDDNDSVKKFMDECCSMKEGVILMR
jgi:hypothetical protein